LDALSGAPKQVRNRSDQNGKREGLAAQKEAVTFVPPEWGADARDISLGRLYKATQSFNDYKISETREQIKMQEVSLAILNQVDVFGDPKTHSDFENGQLNITSGVNTRSVSQAERDNSTALVRDAAAASLKTRLSLKDNARFEILVILSGNPTTRFFNDDVFEQYGIESFDVIFLDTETKSLIWSTARQAYGKTLDNATSNIARSVPEQIDVLFGVKRDQ
jgi:hypothetical protein